MHHLCSELKSFGFVFVFFQNDVEICLIGGSCKSPVERFWNGNNTIYILQKAVSVYVSCEFLKCNVDF